MSEPENHTLAPLRDMRALIETHQNENRARLDRIEKRLDAMHTNGTKALKGFIGHRTMVERTMGSFEDQVMRLESRVAALEEARA